VLLLVFGELWAQERTVSGRVTSVQDQSELPGVNVALKGTTSGTVTDAQGNYTISVPSSGAVLVFTFIGLTTQEIEVGSRSSIDVQMDTDVTQLTEIVVTGYGIAQDKRSLTGSISSVKGDAFQNLPVQSADRAIQGRLSGVQVASTTGQPGGALNIRVRGISSVNASNDPLWIIDGVQMSRFGGTTQGSANPLAAINPNDIESIEVLKDAASAAIYGAQAANGVVLVTTKKGKKGSTQIEFTTQQGFVKPIKLYDVLDAQQFATLRAEAYENAGLDVQESYDLYGNPNEPDEITNYDWVDALFRTGRLATYDLSMSGADDKTSFLLSGSFQEQQGQIIMSDWERGTMRLNLSHKPSKKATIGTNISLSYQRTFGTITNGNFVNGPFSSVYGMQPNSPAIDPETGKYNPYPLNGTAHNFGYNILQGVNEEIRQGKTFQTVSSLNGSYELIKGLTLSGFIGADYSDNRDDNQRPSTIPAFATNGGQVLVRRRRTVNWNTNATLNYSTKINDVHTIGAIVGYEFKQEQREIVDAERWGFSNPYFRLLSQGVTNRPATESYFDYKRQGFFGQVKYGYADKYFADVTVRRDGSSRFGSQTRYGTFYAGSLGWRIKGESFMESVDLIDDLKIRASYGIVGNSEIGDYDGLSQYGSNPPGAGQQGSYLGTALLRPIRLGNDLLTWEEEAQFSVGIDYAILSNRLYGSVEYYHNVTSDLLFDVPLPTDAGFANVKGNAAKILNRGIDVEVGGVIFNKGGLRWSASLNYSTLHNEVTELIGGKNQIGGPTTSGNFLIVGEPVSFHYLAQYAGVNPATGKAMIYDKNGNIAYVATADDLAVRGSAIPTYFGGLTNTFQYKGITLEVFFQYQGGNEGFNSDLYTLAASGADADNQLVSQLNRWQEPGDITSVPRAVASSYDGLDQIFGNFGSTRYMSDASYVRLKQVTLGYELPHSILSKIKLRRASVFVQGLNLVTWTDFDGLDPEVVGNNNATATSAYGTFPNGKQYSAGLTIGF
jgi:TonB-linked SusC/RagA family outer membrane protein